MKTLHLPLFIALAAAATLTSCDKDKEAAKPKTRTELLTGKDWIMTAETVSPAIRTDDGSLITDLFAVKPSYDRDDLMRFSKPDIYQLDEGATKKAPNFPQVNPGTWSFSEGEKVLNTKLQGQTVGNSFNILELTDNTLKVSGQETDDDGKVYTVTFTFAKH
ncbi:hypothetical protein F0P96_14350 [Hymenobacter busanensis]|uniref:Uncharacterized protein n=1 Tax=Hymenobacter busanensis TaxID=2607656 RepID=A0A7L5A0R2_9BACT|nr:hypothetical protein [Hymenobacter busanensis]KAA9331421.1 hypothetical protein F0P96_14350 [Hymenobacter busanensis]QHJ08575.1 hypothetical protein GUY19_15280 [Hymenobacter busanensis]